MHDTSSPLTATKGTHISLLAGPHSQGGNTGAVTINENHTITYPLAFQTVGIPVATAMSGTTDTSVRIQANDLTSVTVHPFRSSGSGTPAVRYIAVGN